MPTISWAEAIERLREQGAGPMLALAEFLAGSRYARSLHPAIDDGELRIARKPDFEAGDDELRIRFDRQFLLTHCARPGATPWTRECEVEEVRTVVERLFHRRLHWFHEG